MAVNTALVSAGSFPVSTRIATVGTTWQAVQAPALGGTMAWAITADAAIYVDFGSAADDAQAIGTHGRSAHLANVEASYPMPAVPSERAHLLVAAQSGTANVTIKVLR